MWVIFHLRLTAKVTFPSQHFAFKLSITNTRWFPLQVSVPFFFFSLFFFFLHILLQAYVHDTYAYDVSGFGWGCSSVGRASDRHAADAGSIPRCGKGFFLLVSTFSADSRTVSIHLRVQSHAFTSVRTLKIP